MKKMLADEIDSNIVAMCHVPLVSTELSHQSLNNYTDTLIQQGCLSIDYNKAISKTNTRFAAENLLIAALTSALEITNTKYILVEFTSNKIKKKILKAPIGVSMLHKMNIKEYGGVTIFLIKPHYIFTTDDNVVYIFESK